MGNIHLLTTKYNQRTPRYTSYPPVPLWNGAPSTDNWLEHISDSLTENPSQGIALYVHLPFCENLCTYCGCNKRITKNHAVERPYIDSVIAEWKLYRAHLPNVLNVAELHLGGGTPTFFSASELRRLVETILEDTVAVGNGWSVEVHPNHTSQEQLETLFELGFRRISIGVQSLDPKVQFLINRIQPIEQVQHISNMAREIGFTSVNMDILYGLPHQTVEKAKKDIQAIVQLRPDRIAYYGYAHVPWKAKGQRRYTETDLPDVGERVQSATVGRNLLIEAGYQPIGMDHYALPGDDLVTAKNNGTLHRNFMGYTEQHTDLLIGLGASSISESPLGYRQNEKEIEAFQESLHHGKIPTIAGHTFSQEDLVVRKVILELMCFMQTEIPFELHPEQWEMLHDLANDGIISLENNHITIAEDYVMFVRSVCAAIDPKNVSGTTAMFGQNL
ncbi:MAG: Oxygen-independent coproporphyrinogen-III oxidase [Bacteroidota bacterium]